MSHPSAQPSEVVVQPRPRSPRAREAEAPGPPSGAPTILAAVADRHDPLLRHLLLALGAVSALALLGTAAFVLAGESFLESLYRTANVFTTTGMDARPDGAAGKLVTIG